MNCFFEIESVENTVNKSDREKINEFTFSIDCDCPPTIGDIVVHFFKKNKIEIRADVVSRKFYTRIPYRTSFPSDNIPTFYIGLKVWDISDCNHD